MKKNKILLTDTAPLYPPLWGGPKRIWNLYSNLDKELFDIRYVGVNFGLDREVVKYDFKRINSNIKEILCGFPRHYYLWHAFEKVAFKNIFLDLFLYLWMHTDRHFKYILNYEDADMVILSHPWSSLAVGKKRAGQLFIYDAHNCEYLLMRQILKKHLFRHPVLRKVKKIEAAACRKSDLILVCSQKEKNDFIDIYKVPSTKIEVVPNGAHKKEKVSAQLKASYRKELSINEKEKLAVFVGAYYKPNIDAASFIIERIAPSLKDFKFLLIGTACDYFNGRQIPSNVTLLGRISDQCLEAAMGASDIALNPMFDGSGINIKMLDYMSYGLPIVTTSCGARGIETNGKETMIVCQADKFIEKVRLLDKDKQLFLRLSGEGMALIAEYYDWMAISDRLKNIMLQKLNDLKRE